MSWLPCFPWHKNWPDPYGPILPFFSAFISPDSLPMINPFPYVGLWAHWLNRVPGWAKSHSETVTIFPLDLKTGVYVAFFTPPPQGILFKYFGKAHLCHCVWYRNTFQNYRSNTPLIFLQCLPQHITFSNLLFARIPAIECELHPQKTLLSLVSSAKSLTPKLLSYT